MKDQNIEINKDLLLWNINLPLRHMKENLIKHSEKSLNSNNHYSIYFLLRGNISWVEWKDAQKRNYFNLMIPIF